MCYHTRVVNLLDRLRHTYAKNSVKNYQGGRHHLRQEAHVLAPRAPAWVKVCTVIVSVKKYHVNLKNTAVLYPDYHFCPRTYFILELYFGNVTGNVGKV